MKDPYASIEDSRAVIQPDTRSAAEKKLDQMLDDRWANEQGVDSVGILRQIAVELIAQQAEVVPQDVGQLEYRGNSVAYIHQKMTAYRGAIDAAWQAMRDAGHPPDGSTPLAQAITKALAHQQAEAVPSDVMRFDIELLCELRDNCQASIAETGITPERTQYRKDLYWRASKAVAVATIAQQKGQP